MRMCYIRKNENLLPLSVFFLAAGKWAGLVEFFLLRSKKDTMETDFPNDLWHPNIAAVRCKIIKRTFRVKDAATHVDIRSTETLNVLKCSQSKPSTMRTWNIQTTI